MECKKVGARRFFKVAGGLLGLVLLASAGLVSVATAQEAGRQADEAAIHKATADYIAALAKGDAEAMQSLWTADGDFVDEFGHATPAKEVIAHEAASKAEASPANLKLLASTIRFLSPDVAVEDGTSEVTPPGSELPPLRGRFTVLWVKQEGSWRLASLREVRLEVPTVAEDLAVLDSMVGNWQGKVGETTFDLAARWNQKHTFLLRELRVTRGNEVVLSVSQRIGWDPITAKIKSWMFDSDGGHSEGVWTRRGDAWIVQSSGVLATGQPTTSTNTYTLPGPDQMIWKSLNGTVGGRNIPDFSIPLQRVPAAEAK